ncbi:response regulator transcription factor [Paenibacillus polymyxa]|uniref:response regulator transcription factor n=1 Tax=Paenibacillus polymyxa TaxID=1406 RepID=UPI002AB5CA0E|nr:response regulator transcription factor [Paenibacillus polymyxa]MDY7993434.1 response regulator transcription factor [Paenibacillus polymyxa]MDY8119965.1 response regulator transcription factor [Paenibacillus polymyxa]
MNRIFIVEDESKIGALLKKNVEKYGFLANTVIDFQNISTEVKDYNPELILLDINLPYYDGYYWCRQIRKFSKVPIIFVSARSGEMDQVMAIENGGDDYLTKPIHLDLLIAKIKSNLRRAYGEYSSNNESNILNTELQDELVIGNLKLYPTLNELSWKDKKIELTKNEKLLALSLIRNYGQVVSREKLLTDLWDDINFIDDNTLTVNVTRLRKKMDELKLYGIIETVRNQGYKFRLVEEGPNNGR